MNKYYYWTPDTIDKPRWQVFVRWMHLYARHDGSEHEQYHYEPSDTQDTSHIFKDIVLSLSNFAIGRRKSPFSCSITYGLFAGT